MSKINLLFLVNRFGIGGVEKVNVAMINGIDKSKFNVHVLYIEDGVLKNDIADPNVKITKIGDTLKLKSMVNLLYIYKVIKYIKENKIDIIHSQDQIFYIVGATAAHFTKIKHIRSQPNFVRRHEKLNTKTMNISPFKKWTDQYITFNQSTRVDLHLAGVPFEKIQTINGYIKIPEINKDKKGYRLREELNIEADTKIICTMSRLVEGKGLETFIKMIPFIIKSYSNVAFIVIGDGTLKEKLVTMCREEEIEPYVHFLGFRTDIEDIIPQITLGVYPTADTAGMVSIPRGGKVLVSKQSDLMEEYVINNKTGILLESDEPKEYAENIVNLLKSEELLKVMEENTRTFFASKFNAIKNMKIFEDLVCTLLRGENNAGT